MPTYEYQCTSCKIIFEVFHKITESPAIKCSKCGEKAKRIISFNDNIVFKGEGFYVNDYKKKSKPTKTITENHNNKCDNCTKK